MSEPSNSRRGQQQPEAAAGTKQQESETPAGAGAPIGKVHRVPKELGRSQKKKEGIFKPK
jgi:hypothetical protein